jgi:hypothetical protein
MSQNVSQNFFKGYYFFVRFFFYRFSSKVTFKKIVEEIKLYNFGNRDFFLEIDQIHYQNKYPYKIVVTPKVRFSRKVCFNQYQIYMSLKDQSSKLESYEQMIYSERS